MSETKVKDGSVDGADDAAASSAVWYFGMTGEVGGRQRSENLLLKTV